MRARPKIKTHRTDAKPKPSLTSDEVYGKEEREAILAKMRTVSATFYAGAVQTHCHPFIEFCGLMQEHIKICESANRAGVDFTQANTHSGKALPMETYEAAYIGEKMGCIYGPSFSDPKLFRAFIAAMGLPFEVQLVPRPEPKDSALEVFEATKALRGKATAAVLSDKS